MKVVDPNTSDREWHKRDNVEPGCRPISLLSFLQAENIRLRRTVMELSLHAKVLREALKARKPQTYRDDPLLPRPRRAPVRVRLRG
jgi:hypothetical protein